MLKLEFLITYRTHIFKEKKKSFTSLKSISGQYCTKLTKIARRVYSSWFKKQQRKKTNKHSMLTSEITWWKSLKQNLVSYLTGSAEALKWPQENEMHRLPGSLLSTRDLHLNHRTQEIIWVIICSILPRIPVTQYHFRCLGKKLIHHIQQVP